MKRKSLEIQIKSKVSNMIGGRIMKVKTADELHFKVQNLDAEDYIDLIEALNEAFNEEIKRQFERAQKLKSFKVKPVFENRVQE